MDNDDLGLFGPGSVTWKVHDEPILIVAGLRSLYLQALHPRAMAGVAQNSNYRRTPGGGWSAPARTWRHGLLRHHRRGRGRRVAAARLHARLRATDPFTGQEFRIDEPELLRWVHVTEVESFLGTARRAGLPLTDAEVDGYYTEQRRSAALVGLDPADGARHRRRGGRLLPGGPAGAADDPGGGRDRALPHRAADPVEAQPAGPDRAQPGPAALGVLRDRRHRARAAAAWALRCTAGWACPPPRCPPT